jgi:tRNA(fMet)-specific endonuclease VapC
MYILDTDHISIFDQGGVTAQPLIARLSRTDPNQVCTTIVTYEEQMRGWLSYIARATSIEAQVVAYGRLGRQLANYRNVIVIDFDDRAGQIFQVLRKNYPRLGAMDLKIAAIAIANEAILLTRNTKDFGQVENLAIADWTI